MYEEIVTTMGSLQDGDQVFGTDGKWHSIKLQPIHIPENMYRINFGGLYVECSGIHEWMLFNNKLIKYGGNESNVFTTDQVYENNYRFAHVGRPDGPILSDIEKIEPKPCRCITILDDEYENENDHQFEIFTANGETIDKTIFDVKREKLYIKENCNGFKVGDIVKAKDASMIMILKINDDNYTIDNGKIMNVSKQELFEMLTQQTVFTRNCMERLVCGQLGSIASRMALDDNQATTIDGKHKGAGIVKAQGIVSHVQYYFEKVDWLFSWFKSRGLTEKGWEKGEDPNASIDPNSIDLGEDEDISIETKKTNIDFRDIIHKEVDNTKSQKFEEV